MRGVQASVARARFSRSAFLVSSASARAFVGSFATLAVIRRASSLVSSLAVDRPSWFFLVIEIAELLPDPVLHDEGSADVLGGESLSGRRLDQPGQRCVHRVVEIGVGESAVQPQTRDDTVKEDAALLDRHSVGGVRDDPKLRIGQGEHDLEKLSRKLKCLNRERDHSARAYEPSSMYPIVTRKKMANSAMESPPRFRWLTLL
jgi:hypothetical protein